MNWEDLRVLHAVVETRSTNAAARRLGASQPKVSRRLKALEEGLGVRLFERTPGGLVPTAACDVLLPALTNMADAADTVGRVGAGLGNSPSGVVRVSAEEAICRYLASNLGLVREELPQVEIELIVSHSEVSLSRREADLLIRMCLPDGGSLICRRLGNVAYATYASVDFATRNPRCRTDERFSECSWVGYAEDRLFFPEQKKWLDERLAHPPQNRATATSVLHEMVASGQGLGLLPCFLGDHDSRLTRVSPPLSEVMDKYYLLVQRDVLRDQSVRAVKDAIVALFAHDKATLSGQIASPLKLAQPGQR